MPNTHTSTDWVKDKQTYRYRKQTDSYQRGGALGGWKKVKVLNRKQTNSQYGEFKRERCGGKYKMV